MSVLKLVLRTLGTSNTVDCYKIMLIGVLILVVRILIFVQYEYIAKKNFKWSRTPDCKGVLNKRAVISSYVILNILWGFNT